MSDLENKNEASLYRFSQASSDDESIYVPSKKFVAEFYPSLEDYVHIAQSVNKDYPLHSLVKLALQAFTILNLVGTPAILFYLNQFPAAIIVFLVNLAFSVFVLPKLSRVDFRRFYNYYYPDLEKNLIKIEVSYSGVQIASISESGFYAWNNFRSFEDGTETFYLYMSAGRGIAVRKSSFAYEENTEEFAEFVRQQIQRAISRKETEIRKIKD